MIEFFINRSTRRITKPRTLSPSRGGFGFQSGPGGITANGAPARANSMAMPSRARARRYSTMAVAMACNIALGVTGSELSDHMGPIVSSNERAGLYHQVLHDLFRRLDRADSCYTGACREAHLFVIASRLRSR